MEAALNSDTYQLQSLTFFMVWNKYHGQLLPRFAVTVL